MVRIGPGTERTKNGRPRDRPGTICVTWEHRQLEIRGLIVRTTQCIRNDYYNKYKIEVEFRNKKIKKITLFAMKHWRPRKRKPQYFIGLLYLWKETLDEWNKMQKDSLISRDSLALITCYDGTTASGLFIAIFFLIEKMKVDRVCDIVSVLKQIRLYNSEFVKCFEHVEVLHKIAIQYFTKYEEREYMPGDI